MANYPDQQDEPIHPDSVGNRVMPKRETYTHMAGDVVKGPWSMRQSDINRLTTQKVLESGTTGSEISKGFGVGSTGAKILKLNSEEE